MFPKNTAMPSTSQPIRHASTASESSAIKQAAIGPKIEFLSPKVLDKIKEVAQDSIQNKEKVDRLMHSVRSAKSQIEALEKKEQNNPDVKFLKPKLRDAIDKIGKKEKEIEGNVFNISKEIQLLEKKQKQQASAASQREKDFRKHLSGYQSLLKSKETHEAERLDLSGKSQGLQRDMHARMGVIQGLGNQMKSLDKSIKEMLEGKVGASYDEMMQASILLLKKHGMQLLSNNTMDELTKCLCEMTDHPLSKSEKIKSAESKGRILRYAAYFATFTAVLASSVAAYNRVLPTYREVERLGQTKWASSGEEIHIRRLYELANIAHEKNQKQTVALFGMAAVLVSVFVAMAVYIEVESRAKAVAKIRGDNEPPVRTLKSGMISSLMKPEKRAEEELFKFAFGLAQHANLKLINSPMQTMAAEVTRLVMDARINGDDSIKLDAADSKKIGEYLGRLKTTLKNENTRLEAKLDIEIKKISVKQGKKGKSEFGDLSEKADFVKKSLIDVASKATINREAKVACDMADKAKFINEYSKLFNGSNENVLADAIGNMIVEISQDIMAKLAAADAGSINSETPSFVQGIKGAEKEKIELEETLQLTIKEREEIREEKEKIEETMHGIDKDIKAEKDAMSDSASAMNKFRFSETQLETLKNELLENIPVTLKGEYEGLSSVKVNNIKAQKQVEEVLEDLLGKHDELYEAHSSCQVERKEKEDQLEKIEFLEKSNRADKEAQIKEIENDIKACQEEIAALKLKEKNLFSNLEKIEAIKEVLTPGAINMAKKRHLEQSESDLIAHAGVKGYSSNYRSVGHLLSACLDIHAALRKDMEASTVPDLDGYFVKSGMDIADGINRKTGSHVPISASVADIREETVQGKQKYRIAHIYGFVPR